jgi:two-component system, NtrC family, sensor kinase
MFANALVLAAAASVGWWMTRQYDTLFLEAEKAHAQRLADEAVNTVLWRSHLRVVRDAAQEMAQNETLQRGVEAKNGGRLLLMLPDIAWRGAVSSGEIKYVGLSVFDGDMHLLATSWAHKPATLPAAIIAAAAARQGVAALRLFDAVWLDDGEPRLSVFAPVGGLHPVGYVALHVDPIAAAKELDRQLDMEVRVFATDGRLLLSPGNVRLPPDGHVMESVLKLHGPAGEWLADLRVRADNTGLLAALDAVQLNSLLTFLAVAGGVSALTVTGVAAVLRQLRRREREAAAKIDAQAMREAVLETEQRLAEQNNRKLEGLLEELQARTRDVEESLEFQTAISDVLGVISRSTADVQAVLDTVVETAARLCDADSGTIAIRDGEVYRYVVSTYSSAEPEYWAISRQRTIVPGRETVAGRVALEGKVVHVADILADPDFAWSDVVASGRRTTLGVPLLREGAVLGTIVLARKREQPFTERQIELVRTFSDQAVIAIENARLLDEIRQRQAELRVTFDNMGDGVVMFDANLHLAAWNKNFQELLDLPDVFFAEPHDFESFIRFVTARGEFGADADPQAEMARLRPRFGDHYRFERTRPDGRVIEVRHNPMPDGGFVLIYSDITERKRSEEEIRAARDAAEAAYRDLQAAQVSLVQAQKMAALGQLTAGIAHEIKNPLNFVNNFASLSVELLDELKEVAEPAIAALDEDKRHELDETINLLTGNLDKIVEHGQRADNIVKSMLEHSRGVSGERRAVDLNALIDEALNLAYHGARAQDQSFNITLARDYAQSLKPIELAPQEMIRVFLNLFGNGFYAANKRARDNGDGSFRPVLAVKTREEGDAVEIKVRDNGTGIPVGIKDKLFQPFFTTKPSGEGTGLGLSISYDIVTQEHGGTITVESELGSYTEFTVRLPRR